MYTAYLSNSNFNSDKWTWEKFYNSYKNNSSNEKEQEGVYIDQIGIF